MVEADVTHDFAFEICHGSEDAAVDYIPLQFAEPTLDLIEPRRIGGREVEQHIACAPDAQLYLAAVEIVDAESTIMKNTNFELSQPELLLLITLISDQLFRREFIDPKTPGYKGDQAELAMGKELVLRLKSVIRQAAESSNESMSKRHPNHAAGS